MEENKEFNLSELGFWGCNSFIKDKTVYTEDDIKEFIRLDTKLIEDFFLENINFDELTDKRKKLAGDKLNGK